MLDVAGTQISHTVLAYSEFYVDIHSSEFLQNISTPAMSKWRSIVQKKKEKINTDMAEHGTDTHKKW